MDHNICMESCSLKCFDGVGEMICYCFRGLCCVCAVFGLCLGMRIGLWFVLCLCCVWAVFGNENWAVVCVVFVLCLGCVWE